jgi:thiol-disulfide isomerase/thioredoxin
VAVSPAPVASANRPMLLVFSRDYCTPCQVMKPWVAEVAAEVPSVDVVTLNVDRKPHQNLGGFFKISAVPTLVYLEADGRVARRSDGLAKKAQMIKALQELGWAR